MLALVLADPTHEDLADALCVCQDVGCPCELVYGRALSDDAETRLWWWVRGWDAPGEG